MLRAPAYSRNYQREHAISSEDAIMVVVVNRFQFPIPLPGGSWKPIRVLWSNSTGLQRLTGKSMGIAITVSKELDVPRTAVRHRSLSALADLSPRESWTHRLLVLGERSFSVNTEIMRLPCFARRNESIGHNRRAREDATIEDALYIIKIVNSINR